LILVFGGKGQVATELGLRGAPGLGRDALNLMTPGLAAAAIRERAPSAVINAAAYTNVDGAETDGAAAMRLNAGAPGEMAKACAEIGVPLVHISTDYVFDGDGTVPWRPEDPVAPLGAYGRTKAEGERLIREAHGRAAILRTSWVFSAHGANFVKTMLRLGAERDTLRVVDDQIGGPTPAAALAEATLRMAEAMQDGAEGGTFHLSGAPDTSWAGFASAIMEAAGLDCLVEGIPSEEYPTPAPRPRNSRLDCTATEAAFGIARPDWQAALKDVIEELT
jgi:dTDP-4-dehydrorhamnose reductase